MKEGNRKHDLQYSCHRMTQSNLIIIAHSSRYISITSDRVDKQQATAKVPSKYADNDERSKGFPLNHEVRQSQEDTAKWVVVASTGADDGRET